jgi:hypothetical protein
MLNQRCGGGDEERSNNMQRGFGSDLTRGLCTILLSSALAMLLLAQTLGAGVTGPDTVVGIQAAASPKPKPFSPVNTTAQGSCTTSAAACPDTPCAGGHSCECISNSSFPIKLPQAGAVTLNTEINLDPSNTAVTIGVSVCFGAYGIGTGTIKNGDTINVFYNGQICGTGTGIDNVGGTWLVTGGTGTLANASGTGLFSQNMPDAFSTSSCVYTMDGAFRKKP